MKVQPFWTGCAPSPPYKERTQVNYGELISYTIADPIRAFEAAVKANDPVWVAIVSIVDPGTPGPAAADRLRVLVSSHGATPTVSKLLLGILDSADSLPAELVEAAERLLEEQREKLPLDDEQAKRVEDLICDREVTDLLRGRLLAWVMYAAPEVARRAAAARLTDSEEPYNVVSRQAILILGGYADPEARALLEDYATRHLEGAAPEPSRPQLNPAAALFVLNALHRPSGDDVDLAARVLARAAERGLSVASQLDKLLGRMTVEQIASLVQQLGAKGQAAWLTGQLLPALINVRAADIAPTVGEKWWPPDCLGVFATTDWKNWDDRLYPIVLERIYRTDQQGARDAIRQRVSMRCQETSSTARRDMPRVGARALLKLALRGEIPTTDPELLGALGALDSEVLFEEVAGANWKATERARRLGDIVAKAESELLPNVIDIAADARPDTAVAVIEGAGAPLVEPHMDAVLGVVGDNETVLTALCRMSESAAAQTLARWETEHSMAAFRALAGTSHAEDRLAAIPKVVRSYTRCTPDERAELLAALGARDERVEALSGVLGDRANPPGDRPKTDDLIKALALLGEHMAAGLEPERVLDTIAVVCREARETAVRKAAYATLGEATPTASVVDLLLERQDGEAAATRPVVSAVLGHLADKLNALAGDPAGSNRAEAAEQLARIDPARAVVHARALLEADEAEDRILAARIVGASGLEGDAERLEAAMTNEPSPDVRRELQRAIRRLRIGSSAAAHERLGELAGVVAVDRWLKLDPAELYGEWVGPLVKGLDRVARAESTHDFGTAIDQLDEIAKALLFRAIEVAGDQAGISDRRRALAATNALDYGDVLSWQQLNQSWRWVHNFGSLHELRTEHIAPRGRVAPSPDRTDEELRIAYSLFELGAKPCCDLIVETVGRIDEAHETPSSA